MRIQGINYDTGFSPGGKSSRVAFDAEIVRADMRVIADDLHCNAVRISGGDPDRLSVAAGYAADAGLAVWFSPQPSELDADEMLELFADCAARAESLRTGGAEVVFVAGCELSIFGAGFLPGRDAYARLDLLSSPDPEDWAQLADVPPRINRFFAAAAETVRARFRGPVTYASGLWEQVDWSPFDYVSVDAYRSEANAGQYGAQLRSYAHDGKPVFVTEFGCCTYLGAAARGGAGWAIVDNDADPPRIKGHVERDEGEQVRYVHEVLDVFEREAIDGAFWFSFANYDKPFDPDPHYDLDVASFGVVKVFSATGTPWEHKQPWERKAGFEALAARYGAARS